MMTMTHEDDDDDDGDNDSQDEEWEPLQLATVVCAYFHPFLSSFPLTQFVGELC